MFPSKKLSNILTSILLMLGLMMTITSCQNWVPQQLTSTFGARTPNSTQDQSDTRLYLILDIDWTLVSPLENHQVSDFIGDQRLLKVGKEHYLLKEGARELLEMTFSHPEIEVSFFSGGTKKRNLELLKEITLEDGKSALDKSYKVLSKEDLTVISKDESLRFSERFKKDISKVHPDLKKVLLVEDLAHFALGDGVNQTLWLGKTFYPPLPYMSYQDSYQKWQDLGVDTRYLAPSKEADWWARRKLFVLQALLEESRDPQEILRQATQFDFSGVEPPMAVHQMLDRAPLYQRFIERMPCAIPL